MSLRHTTAGNAKPWQQRPSDHLLGNRRYWHGPIVGMDDEPGFLRRLFRRAK